VPFEKRRVKVHFVVGMYGKEKNETARCNGQVYHTSTARGSLTDRALSPSVS